MIFKPKEQGYTDTYAFISMPIYVPCSGFWRKTSEMRSNSKPVCFVQAGEPSLPVTGFNLIQNTLKNKDCGYSAPTAVGSSEKVKQRIR
jgi:hypothetical protein